MTQLDQRNRIKARYDYLLVQVLLMDKSGHTVRSITSVEVHAFDLNVDAAAVAHQVKHFLKVRDARPGKGGAEMCAGIQARNLGCRHLRHQSVAVGGLVYAEIMDHDQLPIGREMHVQFDAVCAHLQGGGKGGQRVFGGHAARAAMGKDLWRCWHRLSILPG